MPYFVILAGASGSGKTFYAEKLLAFIKDTYPHISVSAISMDNYYKRRPEDIKSKEEISRFCQETNFDTPDILDFELFHTHLRQLADNKTIERPVYSFETSDRLPETVKVEPTDLIIVEGIFAHHHLADSGLKKADYAAVFIEASAYLTYQARRYVRDPVERGHSIQAVKYKELTHIREAYFKHIRPAATKHANLFLLNDHRAGTEESADSTNPHGILEIIELLKAKTMLDWGGDEDEDAPHSASM